VGGATTYVMTRMDLAAGPAAAELLPALTGHDSEADIEFGLELLISVLDALPRSSRHTAGWKG